MKMHIAKRDAHNRIANRQDFRASSFCGYNVSGTDDYLVYSYSTVIAEYHDGVWYVNDTRYSVTTGSQQSQVREALWGQEYVTVIHVPFGARTLYTRIGEVAKERAARIKVGA
jgi:hypothetical protein